jgi:hypothetical protein
LFEYSADLKVKKVLDDLEIDGSYRQGFWRYSLERLFALSDHHKRFATENLLHIESDVLILETFPFESFKKLNKLAWSNLDDQRDVAALLFSPNLNTSTWLQEKLIDSILLDSRVNDMQALSSISNRFPEQITILPTLIRDNKQIISTNCKISEETIFRASENSGMFLGVFDAAPIGIWLTGSHGVNAFGISKRYDDKLVAESNAMLVPSKMGLKYQSGLGLFITSGGTETPIHTLHIHSKDEAFFSKSGPRLITKCVAISERNKVVRRFSIRVLLDLIIDNYKKGTLIRFLSWLPLINKYRILVDYLRRREN